MRNKFFLVGLIYCINVSAQADKQTEQDQQIWLGYLNQVRVSDKVGIWSDLHLRTKEKFVSSFSQSIFRVGLTWYLNDATKLTSGYAFVSHYPSDSHKSITQPEHRLWQQFQWHTKFSKTRMMQWFRIEERFRRKILDDSTLANSHLFNFKLRYNIWYEFALLKRGIVPGRLSLIANDEIHINFGKQIVYNYFDQNRLFIGIKFQTSEHDNVQVGYMNLFQQLPAGNRFKNIHAARIFYFHNLDLRKKM